MKTKSKIILSICLSLALVFTSFCIGICCKLSPTRVASAFNKPSVSVNGQYSYGTTWSSVTFGGYPSFDGRYVWTDGVDIYFSNNTAQYIFDRDTLSWSVLTQYWQGLTSFQGNYVWTYNNVIYYSYNTNQYYLNVATHTWTQVTNYSNWVGVRPNGLYIVVFGDFVLYAYQGNYYVLNTSTYLWESVTFTGGPSTVTGSYFWTDGSSVFYSFTSQHYSFDINTLTFTSITWSGASSFTGNGVWTDGTVLYYVGNDGSYIIDSSSYTLTSVTFEGLSTPYAQRVWTDGVDIYYSLTTTQYVLERYVTPPPEPEPPVSPYSGLLADAMYAFGAGLSGMYSMLGGVIESTFGDLFVETIDGTQFLSAFGNIIFIVLGIILAIHVARFVIHYFIKKSERC